MVSRLWGLGRLFHRSGETHPGIWSGTAKSRDDLSLGFFHESGEAFPWIW